MKIFDKINQAIAGVTEKVSSSLTDSLGTENADFKRVIVSTRKECMKMNEHFYDVKYIGFTKTQLMLPTPRPNLKIYREYDLCYRRLTKISTQYKFLAVNAFYCRKLATCKNR
ncbi:hypothetical protein D3C87_607480 [compost metagenome]